MQSLGLVYFSVCPVGRVVVDTVECFRKIAFHQAPGEGVGIVWLGITVVAAKYASTLSVGSLSSFAILSSSFVLKCVSYVVI